MRTTAESRRTNLAARLRWMSGEGAFYLALTSSGLLVAGWFVAFVDAIPTMFSTREPSFRTAYAVAWLLVVSAVLTSAVGGFVGLRAAREGRRRGWAVAACCIAAPALPLSVVMVVALVQHPG